MVHHLKSHNTADSVALCFEHLGEARKKLEGHDDLESAEVAQESKLSPPRPMLGPLSEQGRLRRRLSAVLLSCGPSMMRVALEFNETTTSAFTDFIIVGRNGDPLCELRGNGSIKYSIEIPLLNDPCGTRMVTAFCPYSEMEVGGMKWTF